MKNIIFDIGNVMVAELGAKVFSYLSEAEQKELDRIVYSKESGFSEVILGKQTTAQYCNCLLSQTSKFHEEIKTLLSSEGMHKSLPLKPEMVGLANSLKNDYNIYFLSDMIDATYDYLYDFLHSFNGGAYSFQERVRKPDPIFYQILIKRYNLNPNETIFFDDREKNVATAKQLGIQAVVFHGKNDVTNAL